MNKRKKIFYFVVVSIVGFCGLLSFSFALSRKRASETLHIIGLDDAFVKPSCKSLVVVTHGWIEKGKDDWPEDMAEAIYQKVDPNEWLCGYFDWKNKAATLNPTVAAEYAKETAGKILTEKIISFNGDLKHIHLIGHSSGCWLISEAAKILAQKTKADIHLTFLDAYVPYKWQENSLGDINIPTDINIWAEHYYTKDYTLSFTEDDLTYAHNVDITEIDQLIKDHKFPWKWYYATVTGRFPKWALLDDDKLVTDVNGVNYGFARSKEHFDPNSFKNSLKLKTGNKAVKIKKN